MAATIDQTARMLGRNSSAGFDRLVPGHYDRLRNGANMARPREQVITASFVYLLLKFCGVLAGIAIALYAAAHVYGAFVISGGYTSSQAPVQITIGNDVMNAPVNTIRFRSQRVSTSLPRLDLAFHWPSMQGYGPQTAQHFDSLDDVQPLVFVSLEKRETSRDMSGRVASIYEMFFSGPPVEAGHGLVRRAFSHDSAYFLEDLYYQPASPYPWAARCIRESDRVAAPFCIRDIHVGDNLSLTYRFHASMIGDWLAMERAVRARIEAMIAG